MTRQIFFSILFTVFCLAPFTSQSTTKTNKAVFHGDMTSTVVSNTVPENPVQPTAPPIHAGLKPPTHKMHVPVMEELAKIHRFHRERLKKIKRHQQKCWVSAKLLLIICHLALLVCGYLHATH